MWLVNIKVPVAGQEIFFQFVYGGLASILLLTLVLGRTMALRKSSAVAIALVIVLLMPTLWFQISGWADAVRFEHFSGFPLATIVKLSVVLLVFVTFNELLYHNYVPIDFLFKTFLVSIVASIGRYLFEYRDLIASLDVNVSRPYPEWIGGWNTYAFLLSLAFVVLMGPLRISRGIRYILLTLVLIVMFTTLSRGGIVMLLLALALHWRSTVDSASAGESSGMPLKMAAIVLIGVAAVMFAGLGQTIYDRFVVSFIESQYEGAGYLQSVSSGRTVMWLVTLSKFTDVDHYFQWFLGYGVGHYAYTAQAGIETDMGNQYLLFIYEYGAIVGLALSAYMFKAYASLPWNSQVKWAKTIKAVFVIFLGSNFVETLIYTTQTGCLLGIGAAMVLHTLRAHRELSGNPVTASVQRVGSYAVGVKSV